jgi:hypothetical protein
MAYSGRSRRVERLVALTPGPCRLGQGVTEGLSRERWQSRHGSRPTYRAGTRRLLPDTSALRRLSSAAEAHVRCQ